MRPVRHRLAVTTSALAWAMGALAGSAATVQAGEGQENFTVYWVGTNTLDVRREYGELADQVEFGDAPVSRNAIVLYENLCGYFPDQGLHMMFLEPDMMDRHVAKIREDLDQRVPVDFDGVVIIDFEQWKAHYDRISNTPSHLPLDAHDRDFQDDWKEFMVLRNPRVFDGMNSEQIEAAARADYNHHAQIYFETTVREAKRLRPLAQFGYFDYPPALYMDNRLLGRGQIGYGDHNNRMSQINDEMAWMWEAVDVMIPSIYGRRFTLPDGEPSDRTEGTDNESVNREWIDSVIRECQRLDPDNLIIPIVWTRYNHNDPLSDQRWLRRVMNPLNTRISICQPLESGAHGVLLWEGIFAYEIFEETQQWINTTFSPTVIDVLGLGDDNGGDNGGDQGGDDNGDDQGGDDNGGPNRNYDRNRVVTLPNGRIAIVMGDGGNNEVPDQDGDNGGDNGGDQGGLQGAGNANQINGNARGRFSWYRKIGDDGDDGNQGDPNDGINGGGDNNNPPGPRKPNDPQAGGSSQTPGAGGTSIRGPRANRAPAADRNQQLQRSLERARLRGAVVKPAPAPTSTQASADQN